MMLWIRRPRRGLGLLAFREEALQIHHRKIFVPGLKHSGLDLERTIWETRDESGHRRQLPGMKQVLSRSNFLKTTYVTIRNAHFVFVSDRLFQKRDDGDEDEDDEEDDSDNLGGFGNKPFRRFNFKHSKYLWLKFNTHICTRKSISFNFFSSCAELSFSFAVTSTTSSTCAIHVYENDVDPWRLHLA